MSTLEIDVWESVTGSAVICSLLIVSPVRVAELVCHYLAQLGVIGSDSSDVDRHGAAGRERCRTPVWVLRVRAPEFEAGREALPRILHCLASRQTPRLNRRSLAWTARPCPHRLRSAP